MNKFLVLLLIPFSLFSQETSEPVNRKSNRTIAHFDDTTGVFKRLLITLVDRGYIIESKEYDAGLITTKEATMPGGWIFPVIVKAIFRDSTVMLSIVAYPGKYDWYGLYTKSKGRTVFSAAWKELMIITEALKPKYIAYRELKQ